MGVALNRRMAGVRMSERRSLAYGLLVLLGGACLGARAAGAEWPWAVIGMGMLALALAIASAPGSP